MALIGSLALETGFINSMVMFTDETEKVVDSRPAGLRMWFYIAFGILLVIAFFDLYWILRLILTRLLSKVLPAITLSDEGVTYNLCWTTDLDYFAHMNNGKYFREMDFGRFDFYFRTGCSAYIEAQPGMHVVQHGATIRYRRCAHAQKCALRIPQSSHIDG
jgi:hypothetical protein